MDEVKKEEQEAKTGTDLQLFKLYRAEIQACEKDRKEFIERAKKIIKRYRDERPSANDRKKINILWSNIETLKPALYSRTPKPYVERKHKDKNPVARGACEILERALIYSLGMYDFDYTIKLCRDDYLLAGLGVTWVEYRSEFAPDGVTKAYEGVHCKYVHWTDFGHNKARTWEDVRLVWRKIYATRDELVRVFGDEGKSIKLDYTPAELDKKDADEAAPFKRACIYELWDKQHKRRVYLSMSKTDGPIKVEDDPYKLKDFFPCPRPLFGTTTTDNLIPVPDFVQYQDQAAQLDEVAGRRQALVESLRAVGIYDASMEGLQEAIKRRGDAFLIPVHGFATAAQVGGLEGAISWLPIEKVAQVLAALNQESSLIKQEIYEITGLSDIVRGASDPRETATAQQIKGQFSTLRIAERQAEVQRFARDIIAIKGELIAEQFDPMTLAEMSGVDLRDPQKQMLFMQAVQMLKSDQLRGYNIDIETDSTIAIDDQLDKQKRVEYLEAVGSFIQKVLPFAGQVPPLLPYFQEAILFASRGFKSGRSLESVLEQSLDELQQYAEQQKQAQQQAQQNQPPDPKILEVQQKGQIAQAEMGIKQMVAERENIIAQYDMALKELEIEKSRRELAAPLMPGGQDAATVKAAQVDIAPVESPLPIINLNIGKGAQPTKSKRTRAAIIRDPETGDMIGAELEEVPDEMEQVTDVPVDVDLTEAGV